MAENRTSRIAVGLIRATVEIEIRKIEDYIYWRYRAVTIDPKNTNRIRIAYRDKAEH
jgi:hypothetical protein